MTNVIDWLPFLFYDSNMMNMNGVAEMDAKETFDQFLSLFYLHPTSVWEEPDPDATTAFIPLDNGDQRGLSCRMRTSSIPKSAMIGGLQPVTWTAVLNSSVSMKTGLKSPSVM